MGPEKQTREEFICSRRRCVTRSKNPDTLVTPVNEVVPLVDGPEIYAAMEKQLLLAKRYIYLTAWILNPNVRLKSKTLRQIMASKAKEGVDVRILLCDLDVRMGGFKGDMKRWATWEADLAAELRPDGIKVCVTKQPISDPLKALLEAIVSGILGYPIVIASHHQKSIVIDGRVGFCSGCDITADVRNKKKWHDTSVMIRGNGVRSIEANFVDRWNGEATDSDEFTELEVSPLARSSKLCEAKRTIPGAFLGTTDIREAYLEAIEQAKWDIFFVNQYLRHPKIGMALVDAVKRGVNVTVVLPTLPEEMKTGDTGLETIPSKIGVYAQYRILKALIHQEPAAVAYHYDQLVGLKEQPSKKLNIQCPVYRGKPYIHSKLLVVDRCQALIGSANANPRGMDGKCDSELDMKIDDKMFAIDLRTKTLESIGPRITDYDMEKIEGDEKISRIYDKVRKRFQAVIVEKMKELGPKPPDWLPEGAKDAGYSAIEYLLVSELNKALPGISDAFGAGSANEFRDLLTDAVLPLL